MRAERRDKHGEKQEKDQDQGSAQRPAGEQGGDEENLGGHSPDAERTVHEPKLLLGTTTVLYPHTAPNQSVGRITPADPGVH